MVVGICRYALPLVHTWVDSMIGQHECDFRVSRLLRNIEDLTDAAYVEKNPTITGTSLESLNIYI